ncbi:DNA-binding protein Alba [Candidatus Micrarchaeota archaeon]|jgi:DNA-binding protein Alba|nr:DNA-binding protein Alba [Candidatus Micrarchaeota archaeon]
MTEEIQHKQDNVVFVGKKYAKEYMWAVVTQFHQGAKEVIVKARGKLISKAVDVSEGVKNKFMPDAKIKDVRITTEKLTSEDGTKTNVSAIEIVLIKEN